MIRPFQRLALARLHARRLPFHLTLALLLLPMVLGSGALFSWLAYRRSSAMLATASDQMVQGAAGELQGAIEQLLDERLVEGGLLRLETFASLPAAARLERLQDLQQALVITPSLLAYFVGYADGGMVLVSRARGADGRQLPGLPAGADLVLETLTPASAGAPPRRLAQVFDAELRPLPLPASLPLLPAGFDPRLRPWYRLAQGGKGTVISPVTRLALSGRLGITLSRALPGGRGAVGAALDFDSLGAALERRRITPGTRLAIVNDRQLVLATDGMRGLPGGEAATPPPLSRLPVPALADLAPELLRPAGQGFRSRRVAGTNWRSGVLPLALQRSDRHLFLAVAVPESELLAGARRLQRDGLLTTLLWMGLLVPLVLEVARRLSLSLRTLAAEAAAIRRFEFGEEAPLRSLVREIDDLSLTLDGMRSTVRRFLQISGLLAAEDNVDRLLERLLAESIAAADAHAGALYLPLEQPPGGFSARLYTNAGAPADPALLPRLDGAALEQLLEHGRWEAAGASGPVGHRLALPLRDRGGVLQGLLLLWFAEAPEAGRMAFCQALSGSASVALETRELIAAQRRLFEAFIKLMADAIDAKSPYTGGHCARVPLLTKQLAEAACEAREGPFASFQLDEQQWEALHVAAWLHDCGKVTTPEYVVDKATKLETIHDRIHEVRMRFELLKAQAEIDHLRQGGGDRRALEALWNELDEEFAFVAACNLGGETMDPERIERLQQIARRRWRRTLDDRLGISQEELRRFQRQSAEPLPVWEPLLADRPHHLVERQERDRIAPDNPWGFRMDVPELLYNHGELHNLSVARGTLSAEERFKINEHMLQTIRMLTALPFPRHLAAVPEIAGGHHETMDGRGYPRRLTREQMSVPARMMAIADIFEALTAADRPYKSGKTLSQALAIMAAMVRDHHIDADLFTLFVQAGIPRRYGEAQLDPAQIDAYDEQALLASLGGS